MFIIQGSLSKFTWLPLSHPRLSKFRESWIWALLQSSLGIPREFWCAYVVWYQRFRYLMSPQRTISSSYMWSWSPILIENSQDCVPRIVSIDWSSISVSECALLHLSQGACAVVSTCIHISLGMCLCVHMCKYVFPFVCEGGCMSRAISGYLCEWMCWLRACISLCIRVSPRVAMSLCHIYLSGGNLCLYVDMSCVTALMSLPFSEASNRAGVSMEKEPYPGPWSASWAASRLQS